MKIQDILRNLLDLVDGKDFEAEKEIGQEPEQEPENVMVPPLQQNLELMKRAVDVPSFFDNETTCDCQGCQEGIECCAGDESDGELDRIRTIAGIPPAAVITMANDQSFPSQG
jgi:hypothetical protein